MIQAMIDLAASALRGLGYLLRESLLEVPLPLARCLFLALLFGLLMGILIMPSDSLSGKVHPQGKVINLRFYVIAALVVQVIIYVAL